MGDFDHVTWVTVDDGGPAIANLQLSGILGADVVTEEIDAVNTALRDAGYAETSGVASEAQAFTGGGYETELVRSSKLIPEAGNMVVRKAAELLKF